MSWNVLFCLTNSPKPKDIEFTIMYDKEKHQMIITEKAEPAIIFGIFE